MKIKRFLLAAAMTAALCSCSKNEPVAGGVKSLKVSLNVVSDIETRASASAEENAVGTFDVFLFDAESGILEEAKQNVTASAPAPGAVAGEQKIGEVSFNLTDTKKKHILAVANGGSNSLVLPEIEKGTTSYADMLEAVTVLSSETASPSHPFVMSGYVNDADAADDIRVSLRRRICKITVRNLSAEEGVQITELRLMRAVNQSYLFRQGHPVSASGLKYVDYDAVTVSGNSTVFYVFPQPAATNKMQLAVTGSRNGHDFSQTFDVKPVKDGVARDMDHNTHYTVNLEADVQSVSIEMDLSEVEDWNDGEDISGTITGGSEQEAKLVVFNGLQWMDRNLGATTADFEQDWEHAIGNFYQWGRNAAFSATQQIETLSGPVTAETAALAENQSKFITRMNKDWLDGTDDTRWQSTVKQPCPEGYRMPTVADFMGVFTSPGVLVNMVNGPISKTESLADGSYPAQYWGDKSKTVYGIKKLGNEQACYMKWEWLATAQGDHHYVRISRWPAGAEATFTGKTLDDVRDEFERLGEAPETISFLGAGSITGSSGTYSLSSGNGYYWSSSLNGEGAHRAEITSGKMIAGDTYNSRVSGHSIRCIKE